MSSLLLVLMSTTFITYVLCISCHYLTLSHLPSLPFIPQSDYDRFEDLLNRMLSLDPAKRIKPHEALDHEFLRAKPVSEGAVQPPPHTKATELPRKETPDSPSIIHTRLKYHCFMLYIYI